MNLEVRVTACEPSLADKLGLSWVNFADLFQAGGTKISTSLVQAAKSPNGHLKRASCSRYKTVIVRLRHRLLADVSVSNTYGKMGPRISGKRFWEGRVLYNFLQNGFIALLIIRGFCPADFSVPGCTASTQFLGYIQLADHEHFSQLGRYDAYEGCRDIAEDKERCTMAY